MNQEFPHDELLQRLASANPVDDRVLPSPQSPQAQHMLENIMNEQQNYQPPQHASGTSDGFPVDTPPLADISQWQSRADAASRPATRTYGQRLWYVAAALVLVVGAAGVMVLRPGNTRDALAEVKQAAASTASVESADVEVNFSVSVNEAEGLSSASGSITGSFVRDDLAFVATINEQTGSAAMGSPPENVEMRLVDDVAYVNDGNGWISLPGPSGIGATIGEVIDPRTILRMVESLAEVEETGTQELDETVTVYRGTVDISEVSLEELSWLPVPMEAADLVVAEDALAEVDGNVEIELMINRDGLLRRMSVVADVSHPEHPGEDLSIDVVLAFDNLNGDIVIEAPADARDMSELFGGAVETE